MMNLPRMVEAEQRVADQRLVDYISEIRDELSPKLRGRLKAGSRIAITAGSRGIAHYPEVLATVVDEVRKAGGEPFLIPAMGSHGGATPQGQVEVLRSLGVTEETVCASIISSMEVDEVGVLKGTPVYVDRNTLRADGVIVVGRVKPHTDFKGTIESGLMKMIAIGLGKQKGAEMIHWHLYEGYHELIPAAARLIMSKVNIVAGLAIVENARHEIAKVKALMPEEFEAEEPRLLEEAKGLLARLPFRDIDVLIVEEIGKNISGVGMDTNVTGRFWMPGESDPKAPRIGKIVVLDLSEETHGNAIGMGLADIVTRRLFEKIDYDSTYVNCLTQGSSETGKTPIWLPSDMDAIETALRICGPIDVPNAKVVRIKNTMELEHLWVSESLAEEIRKKPGLSHKVKLLGGPREMQFDVLGTLVR